MKGNGRSVEQKERQVEIRHKLSAHIEREIFVAVHT